MTQDELKTILDKHAKYLRGEDGGECANLSSANLSYANLRYADLRYANLRSANLSYANLRYADLRYANLSYANLRYANLRYANLSSADLSGNQRWVIKLQIVPQVGSFTAFKRCGDWIVELEVTAEAKRIGGLTERKCRVSEAVVKSITGRSDKSQTTESVCSDFDASFLYKVGETVRVENFCDDIREVCAEGIHCYITREEAEDHS